MQRRDFCRTLLGTAGALGLAPARAVEAATARPAEAVDYAATFAAERSRRPWTAGFEGLQADVAPLEMRLQGRLPAGLSGALYRNGPARHRIGAVRYHHWFDGDGMVQKYTLGERGIRHQGRFVRTPKFEADSAAGRPVRQAFGTAFPDAEPPTSADAMNVANTSVVHHGGELYALWEGGSAFRVDTADLSTRGRKDWSAEWSGMPFSAHPRLDADGTLWNFGVSSLAGMLAVYRIGPDGTLMKASTLPIPDVAMVHDFAITERHLVFLLPPLVFQGERMGPTTSFLDAHAWKPELGMRVLVLEKDALDAPRWFELPAGFVFHIGNACEERGVLRLDTVRSPSAWHATTGIRLMMQGRYEPREFAQTMLVELDLASGRARQDVLSHVAEFPRVDPRVVGRPYAQVFSAARLGPLGDRPGYDAVMRLDVRTGRHEQYVYGPDVMVEEHVFVPRPASAGGSGREGDGWLVGSALDLRSSRMLLSVFDARRLADGPLAQASMERVMPLGLHAVFVPG
jgi:carotenoid cleavage dioxygenase